jgi:hypothetical protein
MRSMLWVVVAAVACNGRKDSTDTGGDPDLCTLSTGALPTVPATDWDPGLGPAMEVYDAVGGRYSLTSSCGDVLSAKILHQDREQLQVVTAGYPAGAGGCGCTVDPDNGDDSLYGPIATFTEFEFYMETYPDPALNSVTLTGTGALFDEGAPFQMRFCATQDIDPILNSAYDVASIVLRSAGGALSGSIVLTTEAGDVETCTLQGFTPLAD